MKLYDAGVIILIILLSVTLVGTYAHKWSDKPHHTGKEEFRGHDAPLEENLEDVHSALSGVSPDFTPESPEK